MAELLVARPPAKESARQPPRRIRKVWWVLTTFGVVLGLAAIALYLWVPGATPFHYGGDPGGSIVGSLRAQVTAAMPPDAKVVDSHTTGAKWITHGCDGTSGWTTPRFDLVFTSKEAPATVIEHPSRSLASSGWTKFNQPVYEGIGQLWTQPSPSVGTMYLSTDQPPKLPPGTWDMGGYLPPVGQAVQGC